MFDTMTMTKIVGGFCGALLIFLLGAALYGGWVLLLSGCWASVSVASCSCWLGGVVGPVGGGGVVPGRGGWVAGGGPAGGLCVGCARARPGRDSAAAAARRRVLRVISSSKGLFGETKGRA